MIPSSSQGICMDRKERKNPIKYHQKLTACIKSNENGTVAAKLSMYYRGITGYLKLGGKVLMQRQRHRHLEAHSILPKTGWAIAPARRPPATHSPCINTSATFVALCKKYTEVPISIWSFRCFKVPTHE